MSNASDFVIENGVLKRYVGWKTEAVVPETVTEIGSCAFKDCKKLQKIILPQNLTAIEACAFEGCSNLKNINLPASLTRIGMRAFGGCSALCAAEIPSGITALDTGVFIGCNGLVDVVLPENLTVIGEEAFCGCRKLKALMIPDTVKKIGKNAFWCCDSVKNIRLPQKMQLPKDLWGLTLSTTQLGRLASQMNDAALKEHVLKKVVWKKLPFEQQMEIFLMRQKETLFPAYEKCVTNPDELCNGLLERLSKCPTIEVCQTAVNFMIIFSHSASLGKLTAIYEALLPLGIAGDGLKLITEDPYLSKKLGLEFQVETFAADKTENDTKVGVATPQVEQLVLAQLQEKKKTAKTLAAEFKEYYALTPKELPAVKSVEGAAVSAEVIMWLLLAHEKLQKAPYANRKDVAPAYKHPGLRPEAAQVLQQLDATSFQEALYQMSEALAELDKKSMSKKRNLAWPICRYASAALMESLTKNIGHLGMFQSAVLYSDTPAAIVFADKIGQLEEYAALRKISAGMLRSQIMTAIDLDAQCGKQCDLGNQIVTLRLQENLDLVVELPNGKTAKSVPKRGADEARYAAAVADFERLNSMVKNCREALFQDYLDARAYTPEEWMEQYTKSPALRRIVGLLVWTQGEKNFTLDGTRLITAAGTPYALDKKEKVVLAHATEMSLADLDAWQKYFAARGLRQLFSQVWEPAIDPATINEDRYAGCKIAWRYLINQRKRGIYATPAFDEPCIIGIDGCEIGWELIEWNGYKISANDLIDFKKFTFAKFNRRINHIVTYLDRITVLDRVQKDDVTIEQLLPQFTLAQIVEFIKIAAEHNCTNVMAILLDYKNTHFTDFNPMDEFVLDEL